MKILSLIILVFSTTIIITACNYNNVDLPAKNNVEIAVEKKYGMGFEFDSKEIANDKSKGEWVFISEDGTLEVTVSWHADTPDKFYYEDRPVNPTDNNSGDNTKPDNPAGTDSAPVQTDSDIVEQTNPFDDGDNPDIGNFGQNGGVIIPVVDDPVDITYLVTGVSASSEDDESYGNYYYAENIIDDDLDTSWAEGLDDDGIGEYVTFYIPEGTLISGLVIHTGYCKSENVFYKNGAPSVIDFYSGTNGYRIYLDTADSNYSASDFDAAVDGVYITFPSVIVSNGELRMTLVDVRTGESWSDTNMSEIRIVGAPAPD